jgi:branched-chain amino acid transport system permease protein
MMVFLQFLLNGVMLGSAYTVVALGLTVMFSIMHIVNFAHGEIFMLGAYLCWVIMTQVTPNYWVAFLLSMGIVFFIGMLVERLCFRPLYEKAHINMFIVSLGLVIVLQEAATLIWTGFGKSLNTGYKTVRKMGQIFITDERIIVIVGAVILIVVALLFFQKARAGKAMRAAAQHRIGARMVGVDIERVSSLAFAVGAALAAAAGSLLGPLSMLTPTMGGMMVMKAFVIIILGGMGSIGGAIIGGYVLGIAESLFAGYAWSEWQPAVGFVILILVLSLRPQGLFGRG